nr:tyrosine-type recombinase/integrase [Rhizobium sp. ACO-34A]
MAWRKFLDHATAKHQAWCLSRFARFCSLRQIEPANVTDAVVRDFRTWLDVRILTNDPKKVVKDTAVAFNAIIKRAGLNNPLLTTALAGRHVARRLDTYPTSLREDIERYLKRLREPDLTSDEGPLRPLRPTSLRNIEAHIRQVLDASVAAGYPPDHFKTLADLVDIDVIRAAVSQMIERRGGELATGLGNILATLLAIARHYVKATAKTVKGLEIANRQFHARRDTSEPRLSPKNERRLEQFDLERNRELLIELPHKLMARADKQPGRKHAALEAMIAAAIAVLLACPLRMATLSALDLTEDMSVIEEGRTREYLIHISAEKVKNRREIAAVITGPQASILTRYLKHHRKLLAKQPGNWVFPAISGGPRTPDHFGELIKGRIFRETGLVVHPHLIRHFTVRTYLEAVPGDYETPRKLLGHASQKMVATVYAPLASRAAFRRYGDLINRSGNRTNKGTIKGKRNRKPRK